MNNQLFTKAKQLPAEVFAYLDSYKADDLNLLIVNKYKLNHDQLLAFYDLVPRLFLKELPLVHLVEEAKKLFGFSDKVAQQMACDIAGVRLLVVAEWLGADVAGLIRQWGGDPARYQAYVDSQLNAIPKEAEWNAAQWAEPSDVFDEFEDDEEADWLERAKVIKDMFTKYIIEVLTLEDDALLKEINNTCFYLIANINENLNEELSDLLLRNEERLTARPIMVDGRQVEPTIANWLAYFLSQKGSGFFDAVALSDFIVNAPNAKNLDQAERFLLTNLLLVYRILKFFPASLPSNDPASWYIFPLRDTEEPVRPAEKVVAPLPQPVMTPPRWQRQARPAAQTVPVADKPLDRAEEVLPKIGREDPRIKELEAEAAQYVAGSLERSALEEEIEKLKKNF